METVELKGQRYSGVFKAEKRSTEVRRGHCFYSHYEDATYWEGPSFVKDLQENKIYPFVLKTKELTSEDLSNFPEYMSTLQGNIVFFRYFRSLSETDLVEKPESMPYEKAIDVSLEKIVEQIRKVEKEDPFPWIMPYPIELEEFENFNKILKNA